MIWACTFEWCMAKCEFKNGHPKNTCSKEIGLYAHNMQINLGSQTKLEDLYDHPLNT